VAGDIGIEEKVILLPEGAADMAAQTASTVQALPGGVAHQYGPRVVIAGVLPPEAESLASAAPEAATATDAAAISAGVKAQLDDIGALGLEALSLPVLRARGGQGQPAPCRRTVGLGGGHGARLLRGGVGPSPG
jgi:hypothetical protein